MIKSYTKDPMTDADTDTDTDTYHLGCIDTHPLAGNRRPLIRTRDGLVIAMVRCSAGPVVMGEMRWQQARRLLDRYSPPLAELVADAEEAEAEHRRQMADVGGQS